MNSEQIITFKNLYEETKEFKRTVKATANL